MLKTKKLLSNLLISVFLNDYFYYCNNFQNILSKCLVFLHYLVFWTKRHVHACTDVRRAEPSMLLKTLFIFHYFDIALNSEIFQDLCEIFLVTLDNETGLEFCSRL